MLPKISIIIPIYKVEDYIEDCILSVMSQTYAGALDCILVDDCTPDNSMNIVQRLIDHYEGNIQFKIVHHKENKGLSAARNTGLEYAKGEYVYFLDSDDELYPTSIQDLTNPLNEKKYDFVIGDYSKKGDNNIKTPKLLLETGEISGNENIISSYENSMWYMMAWNKLCQLKFIKDNNLFFKESIIHEDDLWSFQLACLAQSMYVIKKDTYIYRLRPSSIMSSINMEHHIITRLNIVDLMNEFLHKRNLINIHSQNAIYKYILNILNDSIEDKVLYKKIYPRFRAIQGNILFCFNDSTKAKLINSIGNCHKILPPFLGKHILYYYVTTWRFRPLYRLNIFFKYILKKLENY